MENKKGNIGWSVLGVCLPIIGFVLWLLWRQESPENARIIGKASIYGGILYIAIFAIYLLFTGIIIRI